MKSLLAAVSLLTGSLIVSAPAAGAAGSCSLQAPTRVVISTPYRAITLRLGADCAAAGVDFASWEAYHPTKGFMTMTLFDKTTTDTWDLYDWEQLGRWTWRPGGAYDPEFNAVWQNQPYSDIKVGSWAGVTPVRSGSKVTLNVSAAR